MMAVTEETCACKYRHAPDDIGGCVCGCHEYPAGLLSLEDLKQHIASMPSPFLSERRISPSQDIHELMDQAEDLVAERFRQRIVERIAEKRERELREGLVSLPSTEQQALALLKDLGTHVDGFAKAFKHFAEVMKRAGLGTDAVAALRASKHAAEIAEGLLGAEE